MDLGNAGGKGPRLFLDGSQVVNPRKSDFRVGWSIGPLPKPKQKEDEEDEGQQTPKVKPAKGHDKGKAVASEKEERETAACVHSRAGLATEVPYLFG